MVGAAFVHVVFVDRFSAIPIERACVLVLVLAAAAALFWTRVATCYRTAMAPYRVRALRPERGGAITIELEPIAHSGLAFAPGQFARLRAAEAPYGLDDHPFTMSSDAGRPRSPSFTVKPIGDFSRWLTSVSPGTHLLVDGPHGEGLRDDAAVRGRLLVAAGIGITPAISVLRTAAARGDRRPHVLLYGSRRWAEVTFREELAELARKLSGLRLVHVLSRPDSAWLGERGHIGAELVARHVPADLSGWTALVCGPEAMVSSTRSALVDLGLPACSIQAEGV